MSGFIQPCPSVRSHLIVDLSTPKVLHLRLNRPKQLNAMTDALEEDLYSILDWYEFEPSLWLLIISGTGRAFCAGQDLLDWSKRAPLPRESTPGANGDHLALQNGQEMEKFVGKIRAGGFGALSSRRSNKPVIAAVHGIAMGGGVEILVSRESRLRSKHRNKLRLSASQLQVVSRNKPADPARQTASFLRRCFKLNCDLVVATSASIFALPEVSRGVVAAQGGIPRLAAVAGHHFASRLLLTGEKITAEQACSTYRFVTHLHILSPSTSDDLAQSQVLSKALELANQIIKNSPDAVQLTKAGLLDARDAARRIGAQQRRDPYANEDGVDALPIESYQSLRSRALYAGQNIKEGLAAFAQVSS
ncbi:ClpP/crotonase [Ceraceosorus guamensis]|uniref:ClpP/crotonase n=1 Tax=Ceraceosorus guamensis TaxID=1522189 RepID=A0A316VYC0_9BASI|nr:ClpP/crotonase [Ceraceosorus guamensis]PWN42626.1 ClpP/crotonase [Ceraceosorus guamensis]